MRLPLIALLSGLSLLSACTTVVTPTGEKTTFINSNWGVVNNTGFDLDVIQDGAKIARLSPGQSIPLPPVCWKEASLVSVSAYSDGRYMGANTYTFSKWTIYNWQVDHVFAPEGAR